MKKLVYFIIAIVCVIFVSNGCEKLDTGHQESYTKQDLAGTWILANTSIYRLNTTSDSYVHEWSNYQGDCEPIQCVWWEFQENELVVYYPDSEWSSVEERIVQIQIPIKYEYYIEKNVLFVDSYGELNEEYIIENVEKGNYLRLSYYSDKEVVHFPKEGAKDEVVAKYRYMNKTVLEFKIKGND